MDKCIVWMAKLIFFSLLLFGKNLHAHINFWPTLITILVVIIAIFAISYAAESRLLNKSQETAAVITISTITPIAFLLSNLQEIGVILFSIGWILNRLAILANQGKMPVDSEALDKTLVPIPYGEVEESDLHSIMTPESKYKFLCDWLYLPFNLGLGIWSIGDVLIILGMLVLDYKYFI
ncbi:MAG: DUF5317 domain-containing protein [Candidatus Harrisonbacteria bacterium]|nr:DUF5317 domain-containing protein [Candidatus Harrisonbacteria bacterium]